MRTCDQCGEESADFVAGYCADCHQQGQTALDLHNAQFDRWNQMTDNERQREIDRAAGWWA